MVSLCNYLLINDVLDISKVQSQNFKSLFFNQGVVYVYLKALQVKQRMIKFECQIDSSIFSSLKGFDISQILNNLFSNALKFANKDS